MVELQIPSPHASFFRQGKERIDENGEKATSITYQLIVDCSPSKFAPWTDEDEVELQKMFKALRNFARFDQDKLFADMRKANEEAERLQIGRAHV